MPSGERALGAEWVAMVVLITGDALGQKSGTGVALPNPARYFASMVVFLFLAGLAAVGDRAARLAGAMGGVALLAMALAPPNVGQPVGPGNRPLLLRFLAWLGAMMKSGPATVDSGKTSASRPDGSGIAPAPIGTGPLYPGMTTGPLG